jgi:hypothetical protein
MDRHVASLLAMTWQPRVRPCKAIDRAGYYGEIDNTLASSFPRKRESSQSRVGGEMIFPRHGA